jgi:deoxyribonuclease-2
LLINTPGAVSKGYLYFDSTFTTDKFVYYAEKSDSIGNPLYNTLSSLNHKNVKLMAWNDQAPNGSASSTKAHAKSIIGFDSATSNGVVIDHSMPQFPAVINNVVNVTIGNSQTIYGQHFFCMSTPSSITVDVLTKSSIIKPNVYENSTGKSYSMTTSSILLLT